MNLPAFLHEPLFAALCLFLANEARQLLASRLKRSALKKLSDADPSNDAGAHFENDVADRLASLDIKKPLGR